MKDSNSCGNQSGKSEREKLLVPYELFKICKAN